ncbi:MAG TPA: DUF2637 domain-containing protein [Mycobacterium sp.]|nr:DUF2637 domain-containing protein [Mycobacterium sp.]
MTTLDTRRNGAPISTQADVELHRVGEPSAGPARAPADSGESNSRRGWLRQSWWHTRPAALQLSWNGTDEEMRTLHLVRRSRRAAVWMTVGIAAVSFVLSFASLRDLAAISAWPGWPSWLWPLIIDGLIVLATLAIVALAPYRNQFWNRVFVWAVLATAALVSVGGNSFHAWLSTGHLPPWMRAGSAGLACVPPIALLATTHILAIMWRFNPAPPPDACSELRERALELAAERLDRWDSAAAKVHEEGYCRNVATETIAHVLRYLYEVRPKLSLRAIGSKPEVGLHHDTVARIRDAAPLVLEAAVPSG